MAGTHIESLPLEQLTAVSPLDGRYQHKTQPLAKFVSEYALIKIRYEVEVKYFLALSKLGMARKLSSSEKNNLLKSIESFSLADAKKVKEIEKETRHDIKAIERYVRNMFQKSSLKNTVEMIHFGLTSEDINNLSYRLMLKRGANEICIPALEKIVDVLLGESRKYKSLPMLARTHGQPAVPTTLGKELVIFALRLQKEVTKLKSNSLFGKLNGAVGNYNALYLTFPKIDWIKFSENFLKDLELTPNPATTQINPYDDVIEYLQALQRINMILVGFNQDMWRYISDGWFIQEIRKGEIGSSTMPQKVNPIDFENSEGNLQIANSLIEGLSRKLPVSRLQRDLSDSTTIRNLGSILGYCLIGYESTLSGLTRVKPNQEKISHDINHDWAILTEGVQTLLRYHHVKDPYSLIAGLSKGKVISEQEWNTWIQNLPIDNKIKKSLFTLTPSSYIGLAPEIVDKTLKEIEKLQKMPR